VQQQTLRGFTDEDQNHDTAIRCVCFFSGSKSANVLAVLGGVAADALDLTGFYYSGKAPVSKRKSPPTLITATPA